jgi:methanogen homocitrate synthase
MSFFKRLLRDVIRHGKPDSIGIVDTMGCMLPLAMGMFISEIKAEFNIPLEIHAHNDLGVGTANTLAAIGAGAEVAHVCVNGIGERSGNTALDEVVVGVKVLYGMASRIRFEKLRELSLLVEKLSRFPISVNKPISGSNMFIRESGIGIDMVKKKPLAMFSLNPSFVGNRAGMVLGKKSGAASIKAKLEELRIRVNEESIPLILKKVKEKSIAKKGLIGDDELLEIVRNAKLV